MRETGLTDRTFGVEIEFLASTRPDALVAALTAEGITCRYEGYNHQVRSAWKIVTDASCGLELVSPILKGEDGLTQIEAVSRAMNAAGCKVNRQCGVHVHHGGADLTVKHLRTLSRLVNRFQPVMNGLLPASRRSAFYASAFTADELKRIEKATEKSCGLMSRSRYSARDGSYTDCLLRRGSAGRRTRRTTTRTKCCVACAPARYRSLNLRALHQHGTVEFRQHSGTIEASKIIPWVLLTQGLVEKAKAGRSRLTQVPATGDGLKNMLRAAGLETCRPHKQVVAAAAAERAKGAIKFFRKRAKKFGVILLTENAARRSRARRAHQSVADRVAASVATAATTN